MTTTISYIFLILILFNVKVGHFKSHYPKLLVVSYDAFRYDYFDRNVTPFMNQLRKEGAYTSYMMNVFVTKTFPNHHTMATGLYAETHGVVDNEFYDPVTRNVTKHSYELFHYNDNVLPIWSINEKSSAARYSGTMMWPGGVYEYQGITPTFSQDFNMTVPWKERINILMSWFVHPINPINFGILYIEEPDYHGHAIGINSTSFNNILKELDEITKYLHNELNQHGLTDVNVVHLSDHGMAPVTIDRIINLTMYIDSNDYTFFGTSPCLHIHPTIGKEELVYTKLKQAAQETNKFKVYKREEVPKKYHYGNNVRVGPIFIVANVGYAFQNLYDDIELYKKKFNITVDNKSEFGLHGYDNEALEMHPMFFAKGPAFVSKCEIEPFRNTDLFPLFCKILDLKCPSVNGSLAHIEKCLVIQSDNISMITYKIAFVGVTLAITIVGIAGAVTMFLIHRRRITRYHHRGSYFIFSMDKAVYS